MKPPAGRLCAGWVGLFGGPPARQCQLLNGHLGSCDPDFDWGTYVLPQCPKCVGVKAPKHIGQFYASGLGDCDGWECVACKHQFYTKIPKSLPSEDSAAITQRAPKYDESGFCGRCGSEGQVGQWTKRKLCGRCGLWLDEECA